VKVVAQGAGKALDTSRHGHADVVFVRAKSQELKFLKQGHSLGAAAARARSGRISYGLVRI
jgi:ABC-type tungstate transport system permease subunit